MGFPSHTPKSNVTVVSSAASSVNLIPENSNRRGVTIFNDSTAILYVKLGKAASTSSYTCQLPSKYYFEVPYGYTGPIDGVWASVNGDAKITEIY